MLDTELLLIRQQLSELQCNLSKEEFQAFFDISKDNQSPYYENFELINRMVNKLFNSNLKSKVFEIEPFRKLLFSYWYIFYLNIKNYNSKLLSETKKSGMYQLLTFKDKINLILKCKISN